ncbi:MAG TPA: TRAP transporter substrate-binding protein DctP [Spirochaetia bacterium]|nr:TRAP transporter substrate-binding protein DctP [Spirochaetia bacterium]
MFPRNRPVGCTIVIGLAILLLPSLTLSGLELKIASVAPENSPYGKALTQLAADWQRISHGTVRVQIYHNGIVGDQSDILRKIRIGQLQGGIFTNAGVADVVRESISISVPFLVRSDAEFRAAMKDLRPVLENRFNAAGFKLVAWTQAGWIYFFSRTPVQSPADMKLLRLGVPAGEADLTNTFNALGFRSLPLDTTEVISALNSGLADAVLASPLIAAGYQWFGVARNMLDLRIAPAAGCVLISDRAWSRIPEEYREPFLEAARATEAGLEAELKDLDSRAIAAMSSYGLKTVSPSTADRAKWQAEFTHNRDAIIDSAFDRKSVSMIESALEKIRAGRQ